jgi:copper chaperone CopZ
MSFNVPGMHCSHCETAVTKEIEAVGGVHAVDVDLERKLVVVRGNGLSEEKLRAAIEEAGYEAA